MDHHYKTMNPPPPNPLIMHYINPPSAVVHIKILHRTPPPPRVTHPSLLPPSAAFKLHPHPPQGKKVSRKTYPPPLENNCTLVVDSSVYDNFNLIMQTTLEVFWCLCRQFAYAEHP